MTHPRSHKLLIVPQVLLPHEAEAALRARETFEIRVAATAEEALAIATQWPADLILFSSMVPGMGAEAFCDAVRASPGLQATRLLMVTDHLGDDDPRSSCAPISGHLVNPVDPVQLLDTIAELLEIPVSEAPRVQVDVLAQIEDLIDDDSEDSKATVNVLFLSGEGLLLEAPIHLRIGAIGTAHFFLPESSVPLSLRCRARAVLDEILLHYWVEFVDLSDEEKATLEDFVRDEMRVIAT